MIIFSSPKPFRPDTEPVQRSAIRSWKKALPNAQIYLFGNETGLKELCSEEDVLYGGGVETDEKGFKLISKIFQKACSFSPSEFYLFINSDILLDKSVEMSVKLLQKLSVPFLATARRRCLPPWIGPDLRNEKLDSFLQAQLQPIRWGEACALDIFFFKEFPIETMPDFRIGQAAWDNWMIFQARRLGIPVIDLSRQLRPFHCDHDYAYVPKNPNPQHSHPEINRVNLELLGGDHKRFHMGHCDYEITTQGTLARKKGLGFRQRNFELWRIRHPEHDWWVRILKSIFRPLFREWESHTTKSENYNLSFEPGKPR